MIFWRSTRPRRAASERGEPTHGPTLPRSPSGTDGKQVSARSQRPTDGPDSRRQRYEQRPGDHTALPVPQLPPARLVTGEMPWRWGAIASELLLVLWRPLELVNITHVLDPRAAPVRSRPADAASNRPNERPRTATYFSGRQSISQTMCLYSSNSCHVPVRRICLSGLSVRA